MATYRRNLPQLGDGIFLSDGGLETTLIFHDGIELPLFASFVLLDDAHGRARLKAYYESYLAIAAERELGFVLDTATWRANPDWGRELGYGSADLTRINEDAIDLIAALRMAWEDKCGPLVLNGVVGPRGDGYKAGRMEADEAEEYHFAQVATFAGTKADMVSAITMNTINEAIGVARAAKSMSMPCVISFTVETDGRLVTGDTLQQAIEAVDADTGGAPAYYMINCAHPTHFEQALATGAAWMRRVGGVRANASTLSHQELDESTTLDAGDPDDLARRYQALRRTFPAMRVLGGCCGTDHRHIAAICEACLPQSKAA